MADDTLCGICGNSGPATVGARYACSMPPHDVRPCPYGRNGIPELKVRGGMTGEQVEAAYWLMKARRALFDDLESINSPTLQIMYSGHFREDKETQAAAREGLVEMIERRLVANREALRTLGVEVD